MENIKSEESSKHQAKLKELIEKHNEELEIIKKESQSNLEQAQKWQSDFESKKSELESQFKASHAFEIESVRNELTTLLNEEIAKKEAFEKSYSVLIEVNSKINILFSISIFYLYQKMYIGKR